MTDMHDHIYLASQSPRRRQLLEQIGVRHELLLPDPHEDAEALEAELAGELPLAYVERVTRAKLVAARERLARRGLAVRADPRARTRRWRSAAASSASRSDAAMRSDARAPERAHAPRDHRGRGRTTAGAHALR